MADSSFAEFLRAFPDDEICLRALAAPAGGDERRCPACGRLGPFTVDAAARTVTCDRCGHLDRLCAGAPFERGPRPLTEWLFALDVIQRPGSAAAVATLQQALGCSYKDAWRIEQALQDWRADPDAAAVAAAWRETAARRLAELPPARRTAVRAAVSPVAPPPGDVPPRTRFRRPALVAAAVLVLAMAAGGGMLLLRLQPVQTTATAPPARRPPVTEARLDRPPPPPPRDLLFLAAVAPGGPGRLEGSGPAAHDGGAAIPSYEDAPLTPTVKLSAGDAAKAAATPPPDLGNLQAPPDLAALMTARKQLYAEVSQQAAVTGPRNPDEILRFGTARVPRRVFEAIMKGAKAADVDPVLLLAIADRESGFVIQAHAKTSSASGLFQFIESTWLGVVRDFGAKYGLAKDATLVAAGGLDATNRARILDMRADPYLSTVFVAEMLKRDGTRIAKKLGRGLTGGEVYSMHFLGADAAERLISTANSKPEAVAAALLPKPAAANKPVFFKSDGAARTAAELNQSLDGSITRLMSFFKGASGQAGVLAVSTPTAAAAMPPDLLDISRRPVRE